MKCNNLFKSCLVSLAFILFVTSTAMSGQKKISVRVDGLSCPFCAFGLEKKLKSIEGVEKIEIKVNDGLAILAFKDGANVDEKIIKQKVKEAGFTPGAINPISTIEKKVNGDKIELSIKGMSCESCVKRVTDALNKINCVNNIVVDLQGEKASFICTDTKFDKTKFVKAVDDLGFEAALEKK
ncbi:MAG: hypothetical protein DWQ05_01280 [Calditrichaeota bacterium]|nr:MAG: hypothetical protein DWQ05_01280 [Calditrichota bacterium]